METSISNPKVAVMRSLGQYAVVLDLAPREFELVIIDSGLSEDEIVARTMDCDFIIPSPSGLPERLIRETSRLKMIHVLSQGYDRIPVDVAAECGIPVANIGGSNAIAVAEHAIMLMLAVSRRLIAMVDVLKTKIDCYEEERSHQRSLCHYLHGKTVGIDGLGNQGRHISKILHGFGAEPIFYDIADIPRQVIDELQVRPVTFDELLRSSDILTLHLPLTNITRGLMGWEQFNMMKPSAILINCSRGKIVDEQALIRALTEGKIAGAGLDVLEKEPPDPENMLLSMDNVVATPHAGGAAQEEYSPRVKSMWENIYRVWQGQAPHNVVNNV